jgi:hypothetical protein
MIENLGRDEGAPSGAGRREARRTTTSAAVDRLALRSRGVQVESAEQNRLLTPAGRGAPTGDLMRRDWQPIAAGLVQIDEGQAAHALAYSAP